MTVDPYDQLKSRLKSRPRRFQFSLRTMFVGMILTSVLFGLAVRWVQHQREWIRQRHAVLDDDRTTVSLMPTTAPSFLWLFDEVGWAAISIHCEPEKADEMRRLFPEAKVYLHHSTAE